MKCLSRLSLLSSLIATGILSLSQPLVAQQSNTNLTEPVYRISKNDASRPVSTAPHALDPAINFAHEALGKVRANVKDYTAMLVKRERIGDDLGEHEFMFAKVRNRQVQNDKIVVPFSVYLVFLKPAATKGREVLYVENQNEGKLFAHEGGMKRMLGTHKMEPTSWLAMKGQRYPLTDIGIENLLIKLIERGERDKRNGDCQVTFNPGAKVSGRECTVIQVVHPQPAPHYDFFKAQIFVDTEWNIPVRYAAYGWPKAGNGESEVLEEYTYQDLKINVGLTDDDFNVNNPTYNFSKQ